MFTIGAHGAELSFYKRNGRSFFEIKGIGTNAKFFVKGRYFVAYFPGELLKKELFGRSLKDLYFNSFYLENSVDSSEIIIKCNKGFIPVFERKGNTVIVKARRKLEKEAHKRLIPPPVGMIATPFYVSENTFSPIEKSKKSYDETLFFSGVRAFYIKNYQLASAFFRKIITKYPESPFFISAYFLLGDCYKNMKDYDLAIKTYNRAIRLAPKNGLVVQMLFSIADIYEKKGMFVSARNVYKKVIKDYIGTKWAEEASFLLGLSYYKENRCRDALGRFLNVQKGSKYYALSMLLSAECFFRVKDYAKAVLAYYYMSNSLDMVNPKVYYRELSDVGVALCKFEDYKEANKIFDYMESTHDEDVVEYSFIGRMRCDLKNRDLNDLDNRGNYILKHSRSPKIKALAKKLMDEAKLERGTVSEKTIDKIMAKYRNDPDVISLALFVYAEKNYREGNCDKALKYLIKLRKLYPESEYNKDGSPIASECINKLLNQFYTNPSRDLINSLFSAEVLIRPKKVNLCKLSWGLIFSGETEKVEKIMHYISDDECRQAVAAKFYAEMGDNMKALDIVDNLQRIEPYVYYIDMIFGDINYFRGNYRKAIGLYENALRIKSGLMKDYLSLRIARSWFQLKDYNKSINVLKSIKLPMFLNDALFLKGICFYRSGRLKIAAEVLKNLINNLQYKERVLFYLAMIYYKLNDEKDAMHYFDQLRMFYPNSDYSKVLEALLP